MMKALPVYVLTALFPFELMIMSGMGSGGAQLQMRHTENTVMKTKISQMFFLSFHIACHVQLEAKYMEHNKRNNAINNNAKLSKSSFSFVDSNPVNDISIGFYLYDMFDLSITCHDMLVR